jgi:2-dehydropantoate 2-reductase
VVADPAELDPSPDDVVILCVKSQDTQSALERLAAAGFGSQPIVCAQNGVANERAALRMFPNVYAMLVVMPATFVRPGEVAAFGAPHPGIFDIGRYPHGSDAVARSLVGSLSQAGFAAFATDDAMASKYGKLIMNLANVLDAAGGDAGTHSPVAAAARAEGTAVLAAAGIAMTDVGPADERRQRLLQMQPVSGAERLGSSSFQSLLRGTGSLETDYLNGEIALIGRLHGTPTPVNDGLCRLGRRLLRDRIAPGSLSLVQIEALMAG